MKSFEQIKERVKHIEDALLPMKYLNQTTGCYFSAIEYEKYHTGTPLSEVEDYFCDVKQDVEWPSYYLAGDNEFSDVPEINKEAEEVINVYFGFLKDFCDTTVAFANRILDSKPDKKAIYERLMLIKKSLEAFDIAFMIHGLNGKISHDTFAVDLSLMKLIKSYLDTGIILETEMANFEGYPRLYPWAKIEVYNLLEKAYQKQAKIREVKTIK